MALVLGGFATAAPRRPARAGTAPPPAAAAQPTPADYRTVDPQNLLVIDTSKGRILVELAPEAAPAHAAQIRALALQHFYDGLQFFRVIDAFMAQTGDPGNTGEGGSKLPDLKAEFTFRRGPDSRFTAVASPSGAEVGFLGSLPVMSQTSAMMPMTADGKVSAWGLFCPGVAGMARSAEEDSANSQFFLMRQAYPSLERRYTAFGRVISGLAAVRAIKTGEPVPEPRDVMTTVRLASDMPEAQRPKVRVLDTAKPAFRALIERIRAEKGADFSVCDVELPALVG